jgi:nucleoside-diphosphate-sugar epimerase
MLPTGLPGIISTLRPSHLLHLAWVTAPERYRYADENLDWLEASLALVKAFGEHGGQRFVGVGSSAEYDVETGLCREDATPIRPVSLYAQCKAADGWGRAAHLYRELIAHNAAPFDFAASTRSRRSRVN